METTQSRQSTIRFFCSGCGQKFSSEPEAAGQAFGCPVCETENCAPARTAASAPGFDRTRVSGALLKFLCNGCGQKLSIPPEYGGTSFDCPACASAQSAPILNGAAIPADGPITAEQRAGILKFFCTSCGQHLSADPELAGEQIPCPICSFTTSVPKAPAPGPRHSIPIPRIAPPKPATPAATPLPPESDALPQPTRPSPATPAKTGETAEIAPPPPKRPSPKRNEFKSRNGRRATAPAELPPASTAPKSSEANGHKSDTNGTRHLNGDAANGNPPVPAKADRNERKPKGDLLASLTKLGFEVTPITITAQHVSESMED